MIFKKLFFLSGLFFFFFITGVPFAMGAEIYFGTHSQDVSENMLFEIGVLLNTDGERINAVSGQVVFSPNEVTMTDTREGNSIISMWIETPHAGACTKEECTIDFSGIIPGGFTGSRGSLFSIIFSAAKRAGKVKITTRDEQILIHDGEGSPASIRRAPLSLTMVGTAHDPGFLPPYDAEPPELFSAEVAQDPNIFEGKRFVVFATQDKISGIDHYEIREGKNAFEIAESPYLLRDQSRSSAIEIKAVDKANNERIVSLAAQNAFPWHKNYAMWSLLIAGAVIIIYGSVRKIV